MRQPLKKGAECSSLVARLKLLLRAFLPAIPPRGPFTELATTGRREASYLGWVGNPQLVHRWGSLLGGARLPVFMTRLAYRGLVVAILAGLGGQSSVAALVQPTVLAVLHFLAFAVLFFSAPYTDARRSRRELITNALRVIGAVAAAVAAARYDFGSLGLGASSQVSELHLSDLEDLCFAANGIAAALLAFESVVMASGRLTKGVLLAVGGARRSRREREIIARARGLLAELCEVHRGAVLRALRKAGADPQRLPLLQRRIDDDRASALAADVASRLARAQYESFESLRAHLPRRRARARRAAAEISRPGAAAARRRRARRSRCKRSAAATGRRRMRFSLGWQRSAAAASLRTRRRRRSCSASGRRRLARVGSKAAAAATS